MQESSPELRKLFKHLKQPDDDLVVLVVVEKIGVPAEVLDIDGGLSGDHDFEFFLVEDADEGVGDEVVEAGEEGLYLFLDAGGHLVVGGQLDVRVLVLLSHRFLLPARQQFLVLVVKGSEIKFHFMWVFDNIYQTFKQLGILLFQVEVGDGQVEDVFVEGGGEVGIEEVAIIEGLSSDPTDKLEEVQVLFIGVAHGEGAVGVAGAARDEEFVLVINYLF